MSWYCTGKKLFKTKIMKRNTSVYKRKIIPKKKRETRFNFDLKLSQISMSFRIEKQCQIAVHMY